MARLVIEVHEHDGRYHGAGEDSPSPGRLFQALVAGAASGAEIESQTYAALKWLEGLSPPVIGLPGFWPGQRIDIFVPNNDLDSVGGDPRDIAEIRSKKAVAPQFFNQSTSFLFAWPFDKGGSPYPRVICALTERLYQFGRGVDMAWAWGEVLDEAEFESRLASYPGRVLRPSQGGRGITLRCPYLGSLESLRSRYEAYSRRFAVEGTGKNTKRTFTQPPKASFAQVVYEAKSDRRVYDLRKSDSDTSFACWTLAMASALVSKVRDLAADRLRKHMPHQVTHVEASLIGRKANGSDTGPTSARVRIVPLPSIGHAHADRGIRRIVVEVPADCPLRGDDVHWAFSGLGIDELVDPQTGEVSGVLLVRTDDEGMLSRYIGQPPGRRLWRTVTPIALPATAGRRRIEPTGRLAEAKAGNERAEENARAAAAIVQALRHADVRGHVHSVRVQREPFTGNGERAERFAPGTRFSKEQLWHAEIAFEEPINGPLVIGNGRFLGLGVMQPVPAVEGVFAFEITDGLTSAEAHDEISRALRRAVMARVQEVIGRRNTLPPFFSGHNDDGTPARSENQPHISCIFDPKRLRLLVVAPHLLERRGPDRDDISNLQTLAEALVGLSELRAGRAGKLALKPSVVDAGDDPIFRPSRVWESATPYLVTRHPKGTDATQALQTDLLEECRRRGLPAPDIVFRGLRGISGAGLTANARLTFSTAVPGPIILGRSRHRGGGLFVAVSPG